VNKLPGFHIGQLMITGSDVTQFRIQGYVKPEDVDIDTDPVAIPDEIKTLEDTEVVIRLQGSDPLDRVLSYRIIEGPKNGKLTGKAPDMLYKPKLNFSGTDSFVFIVNNGSMDSAPATMKISISPVNDRPKAKAMTVEVIKNKKKIFGLKGTDVDNALSSLRYKVITEPTKGELVWEGTGRVEYKPMQGFVGKVKFQYIVKDGKTESFPKTVTLNVVEP
jgi:Bacterial Ig domain